MVGVLVAGTCVMGLLGLLLHGRARYRPVPREFEQGAYTRANLRQATSQEDR